MKKDKHPSPESPGLRRKAEDRLREQAPLPPGSASAVELARLHHELQVHQVELEMQNDELHKAKGDAEEMLARFIDLYEFAPVGYVSLDPQGTILAVNLTGASLLGEDRSQLVGRPFKSFLKEQSQLFDFLNRVFTGRDREFFEVTLKPTGKEELYVRLEAQAAKSGEECHTALIDITDLRQEELFHLQLECVEGYSIYLLDTRGIILNWNAGAERLKGYRAEEIIGKHFSCLYSDQDRTDGKPEQELRKAATEGRFAEECWRIRKDGSGFWADVVLTPLRDTQGVLWGFSKVTHDITDRKKTEEERRRAVEERERLLVQLEAVLENINEGVVIADSNAKVLRMNEAALLLFGYQGEETPIHRPLAEYQGTFELSDLAGNPVGFEGWPLVRALHGERFVDYELSVLRKDTGKSWIGSFSGSQVRSKVSDIMLSVITVRDVSERKRVEEEIKRLNTALALRADELESANQELEAFNYTVAHDLRQPLNIINSCCQVIERLYGEKLEEDCRGHLKLAYKTVLRMNRLIEDLLKFSRIGHAEPRREHLDLGLLAHEVALLLKLAEPGRDVDLRIGVGIVADCDAGLLRVALENLLGNAWKYTSMREKAVIEFGVCDVGGVPAYFIRDNGVGFDMAEADKLFAPFQRLPGAETKRGFGIGLATVERIIRRHGGKIWAEGEPDRGASFYFTLSAD